jgi:hypothetical protein
MDDTPFLSSENSKAELSEEWLKEKNSEILFFVDEVSRPPRFIMSCIVNFQCILFFYFHED